MKRVDFDIETIRLAEEADFGVVLHGPMDRISEMLFMCFEDHSPWIRPSDLIFETRIRERDDRFGYSELDTCDPSYNINHNYDPPGNIFECVRLTDRIDNEWYEKHNCPKYKDVDLHGWL